MAARAKIFTHGGSQAIRRPKSLVRRVILEPADEWPAEFLETLGEWKEEIELPKSRVISGKREKRL